MSTDPVLDAHRHQVAMDRDTESTALAQDAMEQEFIASCKKLDANALCDWAPMVFDFTFGLVTEKQRPKRQVSLAECMRESLDYGGPCDSELMQFLLNVGYGTDLGNAPRTARLLMQQMARTFATNNTGI